MKKINYEFICISIQNFLFCLSLFLSWRWHHLTWLLRIGSRSKFWWTGMRLTYWSRLMRFARIRTSFTFFLGLHLLFLFSLCLLRAFDCLLLSWTLFSILIFTILWALRFLIGFLHALFTFLVFFMFPVSLSRFWVRLLWWLRPRSGILPYFALTMFLFLFFLLLFAALVCSMFFLNSIRFIIIVPTIAW